MTGKRFRTGKGIFEEGYPSETIIDNETGKTYYKGHAYSNSSKEICKLLNKFVDENKQLQRECRTYKMTEKLQGYTECTQRFQLRKTDYAIIDSEGEIAPIMVQMHPNDDGSESQYTDRASVLGLLNRLDYASKNKEINLDVSDGLLFLEENIILLEKIMKDIDYIGRRNFRESKEFGRQREERYLVGIQRRYDVLFNECWELIRQIKRGFMND